MNQNNNQMSKCPICGGMRFSGPAGVQYGGQLCTCQYQGAQSSGVLTNIPVPSQTPGEVYSMFRTDSQVIIDLLKKILENLRLKE